MVNTPTVLIVDESDDGRIELRKLLTRAGLEVAGEARYGAAASAAADQLRPDTVIVAIAEPPNRALETIEALGQQLLDTPILAYSAIDEVGAIRRATRSGVRDYLIPPLEAGALREAVFSALKQEEQRQHIRAGHYAPAVRGSVYTVTGAKGGVGKSALAVNLALAIRSVTQRSVALVDFDTHFGDVAMMLNLTAGSPVTRSIALVNSLDRQMVVDEAAKHHTGVHVFPGPRDPEEWSAIRADDVERFIDLLGESYDFVVIDTPDLFDHVVERAVLSATLVLLVTSLDLSSIADTRIGLRLLQRMGCPPEKVLLTTNHTRKGGSVSDADVARALNWPVFWRVPYDKGVAETAQLGEGIIERTPRAAFARSVRELAGALSGRGSSGIPVTESPHNQQPGLLGRLFGRRAKEPMTTATEPGPEAAQVEAGQ
jgi:pilus assembly protein CpaE